MEETVELQDTARKDTARTAAEAFDTLIVCPRCSRNGREADFLVIGLTADPPVGAFGGALPVPRVPPGLDPGPRRRPAIN
jgi:hypothetical protein